MQQVLRQSDLIDLALRKSQGKTMTEEKQTLEDISATIISKAIKEQDDKYLAATTTSSFSIEEWTPKTKKPRLTKGEKSLRQRLLEPTPIPSDDRLVSLRRMTQLGGSFYDIANVCDQVISMRQELAEIKEMIKEIRGN